MVDITFIERDGTRRRISARGGSTLMEAAVAQGIEGIEAECGGACSCATCHVHVAPDWWAVVGPPSPNENELLELAEDRTERSRLSCQISLTDALDGLEVAIPKE